MLIDLEREYEDIRNPIDVFDTQLLSSNQRGLNEMIDYYSVCV